MSLIQFQRDTIAKSEEVNHNFNYILALIGGESTPDRTVSGEYQFGPRRTGLITAQHDTGHAWNRYVMLSWNADWEWSQAAGGWQFSRTLTNEPASAIRVGADGFTILSTPQTTGNINSQIKTVFHAAPETGGVNGGRIYVDPTWHFQRYDRPAESLEAYRLMYVPLDNPRAVFHGAAFGSALETSRSATDYGIPAEAKAVSFTAHVTATNRSGAAFRIYEESGQLNWWKGMVVHAALGVSTSGATGQRAGGWGVVPLGTGAYRGKFHIWTSAPFEHVDVFIVGYWI